MAEKYAHIPQIKGGVVFSDPWYGPEIWCQYRNEFRAKDWLMKMDTKAEDGVFFVNLSLGSKELCANLSTRQDGEDMNLYYPADMKLHEVELGIDTAKIFCGSMDNWNAWREEGAIHTGADGLFGTLLVFHQTGAKDPVGFLMLAGLDDTFASEQELFQTLCAAFDGQEITKEQYTQMTQEHSIEHKIHAAEGSKENKEKSASDPSKEPKEPER